MYYDMIPNVFSFCRAECKMSESFGNTLFWKSEPLLFMINCVLTLWPHGVIIDNLLIAGNNILLVCYIY